MKHLDIGEGRFHFEVLQILENYEICLKAKQTREEFPILNRRSQSLFEMLHVDLWGPYNEYNICSVKYVLTLVEYHSRTI